MSDCKHPDPKAVPWLFCRTCGYFVEGERMGEATNAILRECLETHVEREREIESEKR